MRGPKSSSTYCVWVSLRFAFPGRPSHAREDTSLPLSHAPTLVPSKESRSLLGERDFDWKDCNYHGEARDKGPAVNPLAALLDGILWFDTVQLEELLRMLLMPDAADAGCDNA